MNPALFEVFGKYGGIGGISLGVFLFVVLGILKVIKRPLGASSLKLLKTLAILAFILGLAGLLCWTLTSKGPTKVETRGGVATGGKIKDSDIEVTTPALKRVEGAPLENDNTKRPSEVVSEGGVAAGRNIEGSRIKVEGKTQAK